MTKWKEQGILLTVVTLCDTVYESYFSNVQPMAWFMAKQVRLLGINLL